MGAEPLSDSAIDPSNARRIRLGIVYSTDPLGSIPGGIESFIRGIIRWAPADIEVSIVGSTTDAEARPVGRWTDCRLGPAAFRHFAVFRIDAPERPRRIPDTIRFMAGMLPRLNRFHRRFDVLEFHRVEPVALFVTDPTPKTAVFHQNMEVIRSADSDIRWKHMPGFYFRAERLLIRHLDSAFFVRENAVEAYAARYPELADRFRFTPTWMDPEVFFPVPPHERATLREQLLRPQGVRDSDRVLVTVGRLDAQKDPLLLAAAFAELGHATPDVRLVFIGDGALRVETEARLRSLGVLDRVTFTGLLPPPVVARYLNAADLFVLASAYEGMPMSVLEALGCGLPVCTTDVGEVRRAVTSGVNGEIVSERTPPALAHGLARCLERLHLYRGSPAVDAASAFVPVKILEPFYANYRRLAHGDA